MSNTHSSRLIGAANVTHPLSSEEACRPLHEQWGCLEHSPRQPHSLSSGQGCPYLAAAVGKRAYAVDIQGCQQHPTPTALACEPGLAFSKASYSKVS